MSKIFDLLSAMIAKVTSTEKAIPTKMSDLEQDVEVGVRSWIDLEDKPFGTETKEVAIFEDFDTSAGYYPGVAFDGVYPDAVKVIYNGVEYTAPLNGDYYGDGAFTSYPFYISIKNDSWRVGPVAAGAIVSMYAMQTTINQISEEYIPIEDEIFVAEYGVTTFDEVLAAIEAGKACFCKGDGVYSNLSDYVAGSIGFAHVNGTQHVIRSLSADGWISQITTLQDASLRRDTITKRSVNTEYPSAKAVFEYAVPIPTTASVGQTIVVKTVDDTGKPTEWEAVDIPKASAVSDAAGDTPTAEEFNALLAALRAAGLMATE